MPQKNAFIIDHDHELATKIAAALRGDGLKVGITDGDRDPVDEVTAERPDVILVRAEQTGKDSGFALCNRVKKNKRLKGTAVFLYTSEGSDDAIKAHREQGTPADEYLVIPKEPPFSMDDFRERVRTILFPEGEVAVSSPPPLPNTRSGSAIPAPKSNPEEDEFIKGVMSSISSEGTGDLISAPPGRREGSADSYGRATTADTKLDLLRKRLREREDKLAQVTNLYNAKARELHAFNERLVEKDVEAQALRMQIEEISGAGQQRVMELERRLGDMTQTAESLQEERIVVEKDLIEVVAGKESELAQLNNTLAQTQTDAASAVAKLEEDKGGLEASKAEVEDKVASLEAELAELDDTKGELERNIINLQSDKARMEDERQALGESIADLEVRISSLAQTIVELRGDLAATREQAGLRAGALEEEIATRDEALEGLRSDIASAQASFDQAEAELNDDLDDVRKQLAETTEKLEAETLKVVDLGGEFEALKDVAASKEAALSDRLQATTDELESERASRAESEESLGAELTEARSEIESLSASKAQLEADTAEKEAELSTELEARSARIAAVEADLATTRTGASEMESLLSTELADTAAKLAAAVAQGEIDVNDRESKIAELENELSDAGERAEESANREASLEQELADEKSKASDLSHKLDQESLARTNADSRVVELKDDLSEAKAQLENTSTNLRSVEGDLSSTRETLASREGQLTMLQDNLQKETSAKGELVTELSGLRSNYDTRAAEVGRLEAKVESLDQGLDEARSKNIELETELSDTKDELSTHKSELATARTKATERAAHLEETSRNLGLREDELARIREQLTDTSADRDRLTAERDQLTTDRDRLTDELSSSQMSNEQLSADNDEYTGRIETLEAETEARGTRIDSLTEKVASLTDTLSTTEQARSSLDETRVTLNTELARSQEASARLTDELDRAREEAAEAKQMLTAERDALRERLDEVTADLEGTRATKDEISHAKALLDEQSTNRAERAAVEKANLERDLEGLREQSAARVAELEQTVEERESNAASLEAQLAQLESDLEEQRGVSDSTQSMLEATKLELQEVQHSLVGAEKQAMLDGEGSHRAITDLQAELAVAKSTLDDLRASMGVELEEAKRAHAEVSRDLASVQAERKSDADRHREEFADVSKRLDEASSTLGRVTAEKQGAEERARTDIASRDERIAALTSGVEDVSAQREHVESKYLKELEDTHDTYQSRLAEIDEEHRREVETLRSSALAAKRELKSAQLEVTRLQERLESDRPAKSGAEEDFEKFMRQYVGNKSQRPRARPSKPLPSQSSGVRTGGTASGSRARNGGAGAASPEPVDATMKMAAPSAEEVAAAKNTAPARGRSAAPRPPPAAKTSRSSRPAPAAGDDEVLGALDGAVGLGSAAVPETTDEHDADRTVVAPIAQEIADQLKAESASDGTGPQYVDDLALDGAAGQPAGQRNPYAEGDDFLRDVSAEFEIE